MPPTCTKNGDVCGGIFILNLFASELSLVNKKYFKSGELNHEWKHYPFERHSCH
jgi:hypothetical protein